MLAGFLVKARKIETKNIPEPETPVDGLKIKVRACAVCGSDLRRWREGPQPGADDMVPGHEIAGDVIDVGAAVSDYKTGDRLAIGPDVHCNNCYFCEIGRYNLCDNLVLYGITPGHFGGFAEKMIVANDILTRGICHKIPDSLSYEAASLSEPCASVIACHEMIGTSVGDTVVVMGAGPIGCFHSIIAKARGAWVIISEPSEIRREIAKKFAPLLTVDPMSEDLAQIVKEYTNEIGPDKIICANPIAGTQRQAVEMVRKGGKVVLFGGLARSNPQTILDGNKIHYGEIEVLGSFSYHPSHHAKALDYLAKGIIPAEKIISETVPLNRLQDAYELADSGKILKVVVKP